MRDVDLDAIRLSEVLEAWKDDEIPEPDWWTLIERARDLEARLDEGERLLRETTEILWDEEPLCAEIRALLGEERSESQSRSPNSALEIARAGRWWQVREVWPSGHAQVLRSYPTEDRAELALADLEEERRRPRDAPLG